jgi:hypothetical protein
MNKEQDFIDLAKMFGLLIVLTISIPIVFVWTVFKYFFIKDENLKDSDFC